MTAILHSFVSICPPNYLDKEEGLFQYDNECITGSGLSVAQNLFDNYSENFWWIVCPPSITKDANKMCGFLYHYRKYSTTVAMLVLYKCQIRDQNTTAICGTGAAQASLSSLDMSEVFTWFGWWLAIFHSTTHFLTVETLQVICYFITILMANIPMSNIH